MGKREAGITQVSRVEADCVRGGDQGRKAGHRRGCSQWGTRGILTWSVGGCQMGEGGKLEI